MSESKYAFKNVVWISFKSTVLSIQDDKTFIYNMRCINTYKNTYNLEYQQTKPENLIVDETTSCIITDFKKCSWR